MDYLVTCGYRNYSQTFLDASFVLLCQHLHVIELMVLLSSKHTITIMIMKADNITLHYVVLLFTLILYFQFYDPFLHNVFHTLAWSQRHVCVWPVFPYAKQAAHVPPVIPWTVHTISLLYSSPFFNAGKLSSLGHYGLGEKALVCCCFHEDRTKDAFPILLGNRFHAVHRSSYLRILNAYSFNGIMIFQKLYVPCHFLINFIYNFPSIFFTALMLCVPRRYFSPRFQVSLHLY